MTPAATACPDCEAAQPRVFRDIAHGRGPENGWDYCIFWVSIAIFLVTLFYSIKLLIRPGEKSVGHIKYLIVNEDNHD